MLIRGGPLLGFPPAGGIAVRLAGVLFLFTHPIPFDDCFAQEGVRSVYDLLGSNPPCIGQLTSNLFVTWLQIMRGPCELIRYIVANAVRFGAGTFLDVLLGGVPFGPDYLDIAGAFFLEEVGSGCPYIPILSHAPWSAAEDHG